MSVEPKVSHEIPYRFARVHRIIVDKVSDKVIVKSVDSVSLQSIAELRSFYQLPLKITWMKQEEFEKELSKKYSDSSTSSSDLAKGIDDNYDLSALAEGIPKTADLLDSENDAPVIKLINAVLSEAIKSKASDIHIEPYEDHISIRFRIDGILKEILRPVGRIAPMLNARIKVMSNLDIAEKRIPQDGRMSLKLGEKWIDMRVSTLPSSHGERLVLRILDKADTQLDLEQLGMSEDVLKSFRKSLKNPNGIILVTGPTGSGKTTTLYAGLNLLNDKTRNILTVEDPIEYAINGVGQTQVNPKVGMSFSKGLRAILRQDPDIVFVGEIRDLETAEIAIQASLTGQLVLSTVHTNDAVAAITRMKDLGVEPYLIASTFKGVLAQRLVRILCAACKEPYFLETVISGIEKGTELFKPKGCKECSGEGYLGRIGLFEYFQLTDQTKKAINSDKSEKDIGDMVFGNADRLFDSGAKLVKNGITSLDEVLRVTREV